eukprot:364367-Chlamydomonas_euryale.AAC.4
MASPCTAQGQKTNTIYAENECSDAVFGLCQCSSYRPWAWFPCMVGFVVARTPSKYIRPNAKGQNLSNGIQTTRIGRLHTSTRRDRGTRLDGMHQT